MFSLIYALYNPRFQKLCDVFTVNGNTHIDVKLARDVLVTVLQAYCRLIMAAMPDSRKALRYSQNLRGFMRRHRRVQVKFRARARREALEMNAGLRRRVHFDLGGRMAMIKWERRRREAKISLKAKQSGRSDNIPRPAFDQPAKPRAYAPRKEWVPRTDRTGAYRLATIPTGVRAVKRIHVKTRILRRDYVTSDHPLEVTSDELMPMHGFTQGYSPRPHIIATPSGHAPPIDRPPIH